jgi:hypothetical protein
MEIPSGWALVALPHDACGCLEHKCHRELLVGVLMYVGFHRADVKVSQAICGGFTGGRRANRCSIIPTARLISGTPSNVTRHPWSLRI